MKRLLSEESKGARSFLETKKKAHFFSNDNSDPGWEENRWRSSMSRELAGSEEVEITHPTGRSHHSRCSISMS